ncbi:hypothetical protein [Streptomyces yangpuensis]|uniref:hypothetical protein n=1 Tax=Streptomyces yangpuensis TaxID=1648182 RepID=UPI00381A6CDD
MSLPEDQEPQDQTGPEDGNGTESTEPEPRDESTTHPVKTFMIQLVLAVIAEPIADLIIWAAHRLVEIISTVW